MKKNVPLFLSLGIVVLSLLGIIDASFVTYHKLAGIIPPCSPGFQCEKVLNSQWATIGPIPLAALGLVFYSLFFVLGLRTYFGAPKLLYFQMRQLLLGFGTFGFLFSLYLLIVMNFILRALCVYCLLSAFNCILLFVSSIGYWRSKTA